MHSSRSEPRADLYDGDGPVYNLGERVEAGTSTIWVFFLAGLHAVTRGDWGVEAAWSGLLIGLAGFVLGTVAAARLSGRLRPGHDTVVVPIGIVVIAALPAYWDFLTSGLETGLIFGWLGLSYWLLVHRWLSRSAHAAPETPWLAAAVIGLGPLVRPDLGLVTLVFAWCLWRQSTWTRRTLASAVVAMVAAPVLWQVFRMGYYAAVVPNTALAKSAGSSAWGFGADYLSDFAGRYWLVLPLVVVAYLVGRPLLHLAREVDERGAVALVVGPPVAALLHAGYVVRIGGDFMHGRMLLPATMCALLPVMAAAVPVARRGAIDASRALVCLTVVVAWGSVVGVNVRPEPFSPPDNLIADERAFYVLLAQFDENPVALDDFRRTSWYQAGYAQERLALTGVDRFVEADFEPVEHPGLTGEGVVARRSTIGLLRVRSAPRVRGRRLRARRPGRRTARAPGSRDRATRAQPGGAAVVAPGPVHSGLRRGQRGDAGRARRAAMRRPGGPGRGHQRADGRRPVPRQPPARRRLHPAQRSWRPDRG